MTANPRGPASRAEFAVTVDTRPFADDDDATRLRKKEDAVREIIARTPDGARDLMQKMLRDIEKPGVMTVMYHSDPEIARLLGVVQSIHHATSAKKTLLSRSDAPRDKQEFVSVRVALVSDLLPPGVLARVIRRPDDRGTPIVLLRESQATPADVLMALHLAVVSFKKDGKTPSRETKHDYKAKPGNTAEPTTARLTTAERHLNWLRAQDPKDVPGVGLAKVMEVGTPLNPTRPPKR